MSTKSVYKKFTKSVHKKCPQKVFTKSVHKMCQQNVSTKIIHKNISSKSVHKKVSTIVSIKMRGFGAGGGKVGGRGEGGGC